MLKTDLADLERRCQAAEQRHQELSVKLPDAARPLLRQIEAMQASASAQVWGGRGGGMGPVEECGRMTGGGGGGERCV